MATILETRNISKVYNADKPDEFSALTDASISINEGEVVALKGPSGSGKTTLLSLIACMAKPTSGDVLVDGESVVKLTERFLTDIRRKTFGFIFQQLHLIKNISVIENILLPLYPLPDNFQTMNARAMDLLDKLDLAQKAKRKINKLSGGEQQRVAIARALINHPRIIIADEPTAHLDQDRSLEFLEILTELNKEGKTIVMATHDPLVYDHTCISSMIEMRNGILQGSNAP